MFDLSDIDAAAAASIISEAQRNALNDFLLQRESAEVPQPSAAPDSFREAFLSVAPALLLLAAGSFAARVSR